MSARGRCDARQYDAGVTGRTEDVSMLVSEDMRVYRCISSVTGVGPNIFGWDLSIWVHDVCQVEREKDGYRETLPRLNVYILKELEINQVLGSWIRRKSWPWFFLRALLCPADVDDGDLIELMGPGLGSSPLCAHCLHDAWISPHHHSQGWCKKRERLRGWL